MLNIIYSTITNSRLGFKDITFFVITGSFSNNSHYLESYFLNTFCLWIYNIWYFKFQKHYIHKHVFLGDKTRAADYRQLSSFNDKQNSYDLKRQPKRLTVLLVTIVIYYQLILVLLFTDCSNFGRRKIVLSLVLLRSEQNYFSKQSK